MSSRKNMLFDTHNLIKHLMGAGVPEAQAEAHIEIISNVVSDQLVTKNYLDLKMQDIDNRFTQLEHSLTLRMGGMLFIGITVVAALVKML